MTDDDVVDPALIAELVSNSRLSVHVPGLYAAAFSRVGWRDSRHLRLEVELGSTLVTVEPASTAAAEGAAPRPAARVPSDHKTEIVANYGTFGGTPSAAVPLLLRAFRRGTAAAASRLPRSGLMVSDGSLAVPSTAPHPNHCLGAPGGPALSDWAPPCVAHAVRSLELCGCTFGPGFSRDFHPSTKSTHPTPPPPDGGTRKGPVNLCTMVARRAPAGCRPQDTRKNKTNTAA